MKTFAQTLAGLFLATFGASHAMAQAPSSVYLAGITYAGSGCPAGSVFQNISSDKQAFTLRFESMVAESGLGIPLMEGRKNCQIAVDLRYPTGWSYAVDTTEYHGYANLDSGAQAKLRTSIYFQGSGTQASVSYPFTGPLNKEFNLRDRLSEAALVWSPCGLLRNLNVNLQAQVTASGGNSGLLALYQPVEGSLSTFRIRWRRC